MTFVMPDWETLHVIDDLNLRYMQKDKFSLDTALEILLDIEMMTADTLFEC